MRNQCICINMWIYVKTSEFHRIEDAEIRC